MDPAKLKVVELRAELSARKLDTKGVKAVLVERLREALKEETGEEVPDTSIVDTSTEDTSLIEEKSTQSKPQKEVSESEPEKEQPQESKQKPIVTEKEPSPEPQKEPAAEAAREQTTEPKQKDFEKTPACEPELVVEPEPVVEPEQVVEPEPVVEPEEESGSKEKVEVAETPRNVEMENVTVKQEPFSDDFKQEHYEQKPDLRNYSGYNEKKEHYEAGVKIEPGVDVKEEKHGDRKRRRSRSPQPQKQGWGQNTGWGKKDDEPELNDNDMVLGWYDSDLNLEIDKSNFLEATPMSNQGFGYIWAGCRATFGFKQGKVCYEVQVLENNDVTHLEDEPSPHVLRVGWSVLSSSMLLGEEPLSYGYGGTGKASTNCKFNNYGTTFVVGDTVTAYIDYGDRVKMSFSVNGVYQREAFNIPAIQLNNQPLFPHLLSKNIRFRVNFGQNESKFPIEPGYTWAASVPEDQRVAGPRRPENREECEMLMMCGLPGCGKTTWANAYVQENHDKFYNILGTNNLIDKMKIQGLPRKRNYSGRWDVLIDKCTKCLNKLLEMASKRRRNYILDQTNVYPSAQKRKMRNFAGFIRRAIVIVPTDEEFQRRCAKRDAEEGKDIPDSAVLEMKANFRLPDRDLFDEVRFIELSDEEAQPLVEQYNKEGRAAGFGQQTPFSGQAKKFRSDDRPPFRGGGGGGFRGSRGGGFGGGMDRRDRSNERSGGGRGGGFRSGGHSPSMKGGMDRGGRGGWQPRGGSSDRGGRGGGGGGWRDRSPPSYDRDNDNRGRGGDSRGRGGGGPWRNNRSSERDRPYDRNQRGGGNRGGRGGGGGGYDRDNNRENNYGGRGGGGFSRDGGSGFSRDGGSDYNRGSGGYDREEGGRGSSGGSNYNSRDGGYNNREGSGGRGGRGGGSRGGFDRDQRGGGGGGGRGSFDRNRGGGGGGFNDRRGGGGRSRDGGGFDSNRGGPDRTTRDSKFQGGNSGNQGSGQGQGWNNQGYNSGWGQGYNNQQQGYNQGSEGYNNQGGSGGGINQYNAQQSSNPPQQGGWGTQQGWNNKGYGSGNTQPQQQQQQPQQGSAGAGATANPAATGYNTAGYTQQASGYNQGQYAQGYWGQYGYGQGWAQQVPK